MPEPPRQPVLQSGECEIDFARRELRIRGGVAPLGARAFEIIEILGRAYGELIIKESLIRSVWPGVIVSENTLQVHISAIRKALGPYRALLKTESGRGYRLIGDWTARQQNAVVKPAVLDPVEDSGEPPRTNLPAQAFGIIGRAENIAQLRDLLSAYRAVTLTGPGGIGKTTLAIEVARALLPGFKGGGWLIELAPISDANLVPTAVSSALDLRLSSDAITAEAVARAIGGSHLLLVLDNCEHVVDAAAELAETILHLCPHVTVLATSREALRIDGEHVYRVPPLDVPSSDRDRPDDLLRHSAVELFMTRVQAQAWDFATDAAGLSAVGTICRHLDGIPLAIEFAAARGATLGLPQVAAMIDDRFRLLTGGRRTALPRHQTMRATLDWSYELLTEPERVILRRLAVFAGPFSLGAATAVAASLEITSPQVVESVASLVAKSLVAAEGDDGVARYRLLDTTRAYATEKLDESGERAPIALRHAEYYRDLFERAEVEWESRPTAEWLADYTWRIDNIRAALTWAFSPEGDTSAGVRLAAASTPLWLGLSLLAECLSWARKALEVLGAPDNGTRWEMVLQCAFGYSLMFTEGLSNTARAALHRARELAEGLQDVDYQLRALSGLASCCHRLEDFRGALDLGRRAETVANGSGDPAVLATADWILATSLFFLGEYREASTYAQRTCQRTSAPAVRRAHLVKLGRDSFVSASCTLVQTHWAQGLLDQAARLARDLLVETQRHDHPLSWCLALTWCGCQIPLWLGDLETADRSIAQLKDHAEKYNLSGYYAYGSGFEGQLAAKRGNLAVAERLLRSCLESLRQGRSESLYTAFLTDLADVLAKAGRLSESLAAAGEALQRAERNDAFWWMPEALRIKGEILLKSNPSDLGSIEDCFTRSLACARRQGALSREIRAATSLAQLWQQRGRPADAIAVLRPVYDRFTEGFDTADLKEAKLLLDVL